MKRVVSVFIAGCAATATVSAALASFGTRASVQPSTQSAAKDGGVMLSTAGKDAGVMLSAGAKDGGVMLSTAGKDAGVMLGMAGKDGGASTESLAEIGIVEVASR